MIEENNEQREKKIEIIQGSSKDLQISDVKDSLTFEKPEQQKKDNIIIPENTDTNNE